MRRKIMMGVLALALPAGGLLLTTGAASAKTVVPADPARNCGVTGTVNFASPGLSKNGAEGASKTSATTTSGVTLHGCTGTIPNQTITTKNTKCGKTPGTPSSNPACTGKGEYGYDSWANFISGGSTSIAKSLKKLSVTIDGTAYSLKTTSANETVCSNSDVGFTINGEVKSPKQDKGQTSKLQVCLGTDTGINTTGSFGGDFNSPNTAVVIKSASIDGAVSVVTIS